MLTKYLHKIDKNLLGDYLTAKIQKDEYNPNMRAYVEFAMDENGEDHYWVMVRYTYANTSKIYTCYDFMISASKPTDSVQVEDVGLTSYLLKFMVNSLTDEDKLNYIKDFDAFRNNSIESIYNYSKKTHEQRMSELHSELNNVITENTL